MIPKKRMRTSRDREVYIAHLRRLRTLYGAGLVVAAGLMMIGTQMRQADPDVSAMRPEVFTEPRQIPLVPRQFSVDSDRKTYQITTFFDYEQSAMVVSANNKLALKPVLQFFKSRDLLNVNDLCVIWGDNIASGVYKDMTFYQGAYTCFPRYKEDRAFTAQFKYRGNQLAHNHILTNNPKLRRALRRVRKGDQIRLKGKLVSYAHRGQTLRTSSFTRNDNVCETIWLEEFEVLKRHRPVWRIVMGVVMILAAGLVGGMIAASTRIIKLREEETGNKWESWGRG
ncbi:MAG: hypothetical protein K8I00_02055 [Candidatus Omnitrophica bacterium]|nr:hypothetical protein [Candidatus Omnitrophota bacterium]